MAPVALLLDAQHQNGRGIFCLKIKTRKYSHLAFKCLECAREHTGTRSLHLVPDMATCIRIPEKNNKQSNSDFQGYKQY